MNYKFTLTERIILETLSSKSYSFEDLKGEINLNNSIVLNSLHLLMLKGLIHVVNDRYHLNKDNITSHFKSLTSYEDNMHEIQELINSAIEYAIEQNDKSFKLRKTAIANKDFVIIKGLLQNIEDIITQTNPNSPDTEKVIFYWGYGNYQSIIKTNLN